ncbi:hypothetical protein [Lederbergia graminis]|uniref:Uncharacterized protein n=1 Tax=Lederbergia graminis TaxID=735518 RepID=A0ABW0LL15_9BACI
MKAYISFILGILLLISPTFAGAEMEGYEIVSRFNEEKITLYGKKMGGMYRGFKVDFKGGIYTRPFWNSVTTQAFLPKIFYLDINEDQKKELIITLTTGHGTGLLLEEVHVFNTLDDHLLGNEVIVDNPLAIIHKNVKTNLTKDHAEIRVRDKQYKINIAPLDIDSKNLFKDIIFENIIDYEVMNNQLMVSVSGQIAPASFIGDIIITYEYRDNMYQAKTIDFIADMKKNPFYGPVTSSDYRVK